MTIEFWTPIDRFPYFEYSYSIFVDNDFKVPLVGEYTYNPGDRVDGKSGPRMVVKYSTTEYVYGDGLGGHRSDYGVVVRLDLMPLDSEKPGIGA